MKFELLNFDGRTEFRTLRGSEFRIIFSVHCTNLEKWLRFQIFEFRFSVAVILDKTKSELQHSTTVCAVTSIKCSRITTEFIRDWPLELEFHRNWTSMVIHCHLVPFLVADWIVSQIITFTSQKQTNTHNFQQQSLSDDARQMIMVMNMLACQKLGKNKINSFASSRHSIQKLKTGYISKI